MKILFIEWASYGKDDLKKAMVEEGYELVIFPFSVSSSTYGKLTDDPDTEERLGQFIRQTVPDIVYSTNFFPVISKVCQKEGVRYISWNYDAPNMFLYSALIANSCNVIYTFDKMECMKYREMGYSNFYYLPLAVNVERLDALFNNSGNSQKFIYDVSFVGSLYMKSDYFDKIEPNLSDRARGYLKALIAIQLKIRGYDLIEEMLPSIMEDLQKVCSITVQPGLIVTSEAFYEHTIIIPRITAIERLDLIELLAQHYSLDLFTTAADIMLPNVHVHGGVDYYNEMPFVFRRSKINLNITSRSIVSGVPLRAFDIMGSGGFLLSNYQCDFMGHFTPEEDFIYFENKEDLLRKVDYYLTHEAEREAIAKNGHDKVAAEHTYRHRVREMFQFI